MKRVLSLAILLLSTGNGYGQAGDPPPPPMLASSASDDIEAGWEDPELWGAVYAASVPAEAELLARYDSTVGPIRQTLSLFQTGHVTLRWQQDDLVTNRQMLLPAEAIDHWREILRPLQETDRTQRPSRFLSQSDVTRIDVYSGGVTHSHSFSATAALPTRLGQVRELLDALANAMLLDRQISNPVAHYTPREGDVLITGDGEGYRVKRVLSERHMVELRRTEPPMTLWVAWRDLYTMFTTIIPGGKPIQ